MSAPGRRGWADWQIVTAWFAITRLVVAVAVAMGAAHLKAGFHYRLLDDAPIPPLLVPFVRWDAGFYVDLARHGYPPAGSAPVFHVAFFPLYPALIRLVDFALHDTIVSSLL